MPLTGFLGAIIAGVLLVVAANRPVPFLEYREPRRWHRPGWSGGRDAVDTAWLLRQYDQDEKDKRAKERLRLLDRLR